MSGALAALLLVGVMAAQPGEDTLRSQAGPLWPPPETSLPAEDAWRRFECGRCHATSRHEDEAPRDRSCVRCHQAIFDGGVLADPLQLEAWRGRIQHLREVPSLDVAGRLRASWIAAYVQAPHDLRRGLGESMPRLPVTPEDAALLAAFLTRGQEPPDHPVRKGDVAAGFALLEAKGCGSCHAYTGALVGGAPRPLVPRAVAVAVDGLRMVRGMSLAPDLRFTRDRTTAAAAQSWLRATDLREPRVMPWIELTEDETADVLAAIFDAPLAPLSRRAPPPRLPVLARKVRFAEVQERVFKKTCIHCHADDSLQMGLGGPGNNGGFGYAGTGLVLSSYSRTQAGSFDLDTGKRRSIYRPVPSGPLAGLPLVVAQLRARQLEETGETVDGIVGMPLGLPALTAEELQLVESWVVQGRPQ